MEITKEERGWQGHFICRCDYHRNTLIFDRDGFKRYVISTIGNMRDNNLKTDTVGYDRYYETYVFEAKLDGAYWDADVTKQIYLGDLKWAIDTKEFERYKECVDNLADMMHDATVLEIENQIRRGEL